jgi:diketogulonate reductase-like aldo/keto reductase
MELMVPRRMFGWTGVEVPVLGQGTWNIEGSPDQERRAVNALRAGLDLGMTHIDTAEMYGSGRAEELVAAAISGRRHEVFLASKVLPSNASYEGTLRACEQSLRRLKTHYIDLYMLHWAGRHPIEETMRAMRKLLEQGSIRFAGVSNLDVMGLGPAVKTGLVACDQVLYHLGDRGIERRVLPYCAERSIAVVAYSPFGQSRFPERSKALLEIAKRHGRTPRQVALNFLTRDPNVFAIPKTSRPERVQENAGGAGWQLTPEDIAAIDRAFPAPDHDVPLGMI